ncbi:DUF3616 domain-containing protein [Rhizobium leguminosarum]|uniref:DUF3616 domain-containing protein n=1 Tax=Rhizobium leguminosarum TaxID=384 RepID=UPI0013D93936|nr:DUF3616 domain-containing protein [Rhizobium leguminosarum]NEK35623.1 DUF3616 domain-containing protein [Rhizobium leguminosarum]
MRYERFGTALLAINLALATSPAMAAIFEYEGVCEASAAVKLDDDHFVVASDETETLTVYRRNEKRPVSTLPLADVTDIEAAARIGDTIFWLTSHSLNKDGEDKPKRKLLLATQIDPDGHTLRLVGEYRQLRARIAEALGTDEALLMPNLNIEGLAATPGGDLLIGLRGPLAAENKAQVIRLKNPLIPSTLPAAAETSPDEEIPPVSGLFLDGLGIRSLEKIGTGEHAYLIVAGSVADGGPQPKLYWWNGKHDLQPHTAVDLQGMVPEALFAWNEEEFQVLGDNGGACSDESDNRRWFPSLIVKP